jgi:hypothetical protein
LKKKAFQKTRLHHQKYFEKKKHSKRHAYIINSTLKKKAFQKTRLYHQKYFEKKAFQKTRLHHQKYFEKKGIPKDTPTSSKVL